MTEMAITYTLNNGSGETAESVNIKPLRTGWTEYENDSTDNRSIREWRQTGDNIDLPLVLKIIRVKRNVFHAAQTAKDAMPGTEITVHISTDISVEDSASNRLPSIVFNAQLKLQYGGVYLPESDDALDIVLTLVSFMYPSVTSGTPASGNIAKIAAGGINLV